MTGPRTQLRRLAFFAASLTAMTLVGSVAALGSSLAAAASPPTISVISTRADLISGGVALVDISLPQNASLESIHVRLNGSDITSEFALRPNGRFEGLVSGLRLGANQLETTGQGGNAAITLTNHPIGGPVFSGPQIQPWTCQATADPGDPQCNQPTAYAFWYRDYSKAECSAASVTLGVSSPPNAIGCFLPWTAATPAASVPNTTTDNGQTVPYIIRIETGYQDRDQYNAAVLFNPGNPSWEPWAPQPQWDSKLLVPGGFSCGEGHEAVPQTINKTAPPGVTDDTALSRGYMVAAPALDHNQINCNLVVQAEAVEMMKEHIVDTYGPIRFTIGSGCSGGSIYQQQMANAYPGLLNGILPNCSYPDTWSTTMDPVECELLQSFFGIPAIGKPATATAVSDGFAANAAGQAATEDNLNNFSSCGIWYLSNFWKEYNPSVGDGFPSLCGLAPNLIYDAKTNPNGVRCSLQDYMTNELGFRPSSVWTANEQANGHGFANLPFDNVGVQYGFNALLAGAITPQQFVDLNSQVGGVSIDDVHQAARSVADPEGLASSYRTGAINEANNLATAAILDLRANDNIEIHTNFRSWLLRARLDAAFGNHRNQVIWISGGPSGPPPPQGLAGYVTPTRTLLSDGFLEMDRWLAAVSNDHSGASLAQKIATDKPSTAVDTCFDSGGVVIPNCFSSDGTSASPTYNYYGDPRIGSGQAPVGLNKPHRDDIFKCQLKPLSALDYPGVTFTGAQWSTLQATFSGGVCDWTKQGVGQGPTVSWLTYQDASGNVIFGGVPLGPAPVSQPIG